MSDGVCNRASLLKVLWQREGASFQISEETVTTEMERLIRKAGLNKKWSVVRMLSGTLEKVVDSLAPSITTILVSGKQVVSDFNAAGYVCVYLDADRCRYAFVDFPFIGCK